MSSNLQKLKYLLSMLRGRIGEPLEDDFTDIELVNLLNLGQFDVARRLLKINKEWFSAFETLTGAVTPNGYCYYDLTSLASGKAVFQIEALTQGGGNPITRFDIEDVGLIVSNTMYTPSANDPRFVHIGDRIYIWPATNNPILYFTEKPVELVADDDVTILPVEFVDMLLAYGEWRCAGKKKLDVKQKEKEYDEMFVEVELRYRRDVKAETPGTEEEGK